MSRALPTIAAFLALCAPAAAGVTSPQSGWYSGNPLLGPNNLEDLACAGQACYAAGQFGTLLSSADGGGAWSGVVTGLTQDLPRVRLIAGDANKIVAGGGCSLRRSDDGGEHFRRLPLNRSEATCRDRVISFSFPASDVGFVLLSDGSVFRTRDGGVTFERRTSVFPGISGSPADSVDDILCTSTSRCFALWRQSRLARTDDGGATWTVVASTTDDFKVVVPLHAITFADANNGYAVGSGPILKTTDGGETWERLEPAAPEELTGVTCSPESPEVCLFSTRAGDHILRTVDGGRTLTPVVSSPDPVHAVAFASPTRALAAGAGGSAEVSDDAGVTWAPVGKRAGGQFTVLRAVSSTLAFAAGNGGALARTQDSGQSWSSVNPPASAQIRDVASPDGQKIYVIDSSGGLERSTDGGSSYQSLSTAGITPSAVVAIGADRVLLVGRRSLLLSAGAGDRFRRVTPQLAKKDILSSADRAPGALFAYGARALLVSTDAARTWRHMKLPRLARSDSLRRVDFVAPRLGYVLTGTRRVFKTRDAGHHWAELLSTGGAGGDLAFSDPRHGYLTAPGFAYRFNGAILRTSDGGATWRPQIVAPGFLQAVATAGSTDYALAEGSSLYATRTGGDAGAPSRLTFTPSARKLGRSGTVTLKGRLTPADGGEEVVVSAHSSRRWITRLVTIASNGAWKSTWRLNRSTAFVAQVLGDADHAGAGTRADFVRVVGR